MASSPPSRRPISLAQRLTVSIGLIITLVFLALGWLIEGSLAHHFAMQDAEELEVVARSIQQVLTTLPYDASRDELTHRLSDAVKGHHGMYYQVQDAQGRTLFATPGPHLNAIARPPTAVTDIEAGHLHTWQEQGQAYRGAVVDIPPSEGSQQHYTAVVATSTGFHDHFLARFRQTIWVATSVAGLFAILATWLAVYRGHAPLREISARIRGLSANQLDVRLDPGQVPIELSELATSFNATLERIEQDFQRLSNFSADIAHELRTPVTNLITQTQVLLSKDRRTEAYREVLYSNLEEYERMAKMIGDMLYLAQTDNQLIKPDRADLDLSVELDALFEYFEPWADERHVRLTRVGTLPPIRGDRLMLRRALSNLLSNAIRHTAAGQTVTVALDSDDHQAVIQVTNPGPTIAPEHLPHLFDRFYRVDPSRQRNGDGAGLGLAIVKSIVEAHGGEIAARSSNEVTTFEVRLPHP
ncbi:MAG: heavy metal sensor histidine kinase [Burkholderiales bacterium]|nr:heavy metal sensor histidine kinase [Burkholderiales bacterium]